MLSSIVIGQQADPRLDTCHLWDPPSRTIFTVTRVPGPPQAGSRPSTAGLGTLHVYRAHGWGRFRDIDVPDDPGVHAFLAYLRRGHDRRRAAVLARRYLRTWYPGSGTGLNAIRISSETGDRYIEVVAHVRHGGNVDALLECFSLWMNGDIWSVAPQDDPDDARLVYAPDAVTALNRHLGW